MDEKTTCKITKQADIPAIKSADPSEDQMKKINAYARKELKPEDVYIFTVKLCDNDIDRDGEAFTDQALEKLSELYIGKTGIKDHRHSTENQVARIFDTAVKTEDRLNKTGEPYKYLEAEVYIARTESNHDLIVELDAGIKKEVSIGCMIGKASCSICGEDDRKYACEHRKGKEYDGKQCYVKLEDPQDAYEFSFVAVPAQKEAGVIKSFDKGDKTFSNRLRILNFETMKGENGSMTEKLKTLYAQLEEKKSKAKVYHQDGELEKASSALDEAEAISKQIKVEERLEKMEIDGKNLTELTPAAKNEKPNPADAFIKGVKAYTPGVTLSNEEAEVIKATTMTEGIPEDGGLTVPQDIRTKINELRRSYPDALENYVNVEHVSTLSGSRVIEKNSDYVPFDNIEEAAEFPEMEAPKFDSYDYKVKKKGGVLAVTKELLSDTAENIKGYLVRWLGKKSKVTRNALILKVLDDTAAGGEVAITDIDDLKDIFNTQLDPAIALTSSIITNQDGFNYLDKLKDSDENYILQPDPSQKTKMLLFGKYPVVVLSNKTLPSVSDKAPIYCGDLKEAVTIFDRNTMSIDYNDKGDSYWKFQKVGILAYERLDVKVIDGEAFVKGFIG